MAKIWQSVILSILGSGAMLAAPGTAGAQIDNPSVAPPAVESSAPPAAGTAVAPAATGGVAVPSSSVGSAVAPVDSGAPVAPVANSDVPVFDAWVAEASKKAGVIPRSVVFVRSLGDTPGSELRFLPLDTEAFNKLSFISAANSTNADWDFKLNKRKFAGMDRLAAVVALTGADCVVLAPEKGEWQVIRPDGAKRTILSTGQAPKSTANEDLIEWLFISLGWDGIVLDQKGNYLLVGSTSKSMSFPQIQALAVNDSTAKIVLKANERIGAGLLSLRETKMGVGIFDIVFLGQGITSIPIGTKLVIEKKN